jgi:hypothetical protein
VRRSGLDKRAAQELVRVGMWSREEGGYLFHDWLKHNPSKEKVLEEREANRLRVEASRAKGGKGKGNNGGSGGGNGSCNTITEPVTPPATNALGKDPPTGSRPDPKEEAAAAIPDLPLRAEDIAAAWHRALSMPGGGDLLTMHAQRSWRAEYETVAVVINALPPQARAVGLQAVCEWFWLAPDGPVQSGRISRKNANPGHLAKNISRDLQAANAWFAERQEAAQ